MRIKYFSEFACDEFVNTTKHNQFLSRNVTIKNKRDQQ